LTLLKYIETYLTRKKEDNIKIKMNHIHEYENQIREEI